MNPTRTVELSAGRAARQAHVLSALGDPARLRILRAIRSGKTCACELGPELQIPATLLSYHLRILREAGLIEGMKAGRRTEHRIVPEAIQDLVSELVGLALGVDRED